MNVYPSQSVVDKVGGFWAALWNRNRRKARQCRMKNPVVRNGMNESDVLTKTGPNEGRSIWKRVLPCFGNRKVAPLRECKEDKNEGKRRRNEKSKDVKKIDAAIMVNRNGQYYLRVLDNFEVCVAWRRDEMMILLDRIVSDSGLDGLDITEALRSAIRKYTLILEEVFPKFAEVCEANLEYWAGNPTEENWVKPILNEGLEDLWSDIRHLVGSVE